MKSTMAKIGVIIVVSLTAMAIFAPLLAPYDPNAYDLTMQFAGPSWQHPFGCNGDGRDVLSRIIYGTRISLGIGVAVVTISMTIGCAWGVVVGWVGGRLDRLSNFIIDVFLAFPGFLFAVAIAAFLRPSIGNVILILCLKGWVTYARLVRGQTLSLKHREFVTAGRAIGVGRWRMYVRHLLPNMVGPIVVNASFGMAGVIMIESALSFLGLGVPPNTPSWGAMLDQGTQYILLAPYLSIFPGIFIMLVVLGFNFMGDGLRDKLAPRGR